ncbi:MAG: amino acid adenylation domain-containing protein, partial [Chloroflexota bacterium]
VRALNFGSYPNPLGLPKVNIGSDFFIVPRIAILDSLSSAPPGTITAINQEFIKVSTTDRDVALSNFLTIDGQPQAMSDLVEQLNLRVGDRFRELDRDLATRITARNAAACEHEKFWVERLATLRPISLSGTTLRPDNARHGRYAKKPIQLPEEAIILLNRHASWSRADFLVTAFSAYLARVTGIATFDLGFSDSGMLDNLLGLEGFFARQLPLRLHVDNEQTFSEFYKVVREQLDLIERHETYARDAAARYPALHPAGELRENPSFPVSIQKAKQAGPCAFDSEFTLLIEEDTEQCLWVYEADRLSERDIDRMTDQFTVFLKGIAKGADPIGQIPLLNSEEYRLLCFEINNTTTEYPYDRCVHQLIEDQAERTPEAIALVAGGTQLTYRELDARANQLAHHLTNAGVGRETPVAICLERSPEMVLGLLGILKAGGTYVPLHPNYPSERFDLILADTEAPVLLSQERFVRRLPEYSGKIILLDTDWKTLAQESRHRLPCVASPGSLAYINYTSGSTGTPNGCMIEHRSLVNYLCWVNDSLMPSGLEAIPAISGVNFDACLKQLIAPLVRGGQTWLISDEDSVDPARLLQELGSKRAVGLNCVPSLWRMILDAVNSAKVPPVQSLVCLFLGGEPLSRDLLQKTRAALPHLRIWNLYGPTETTANTTAVELFCDHEPTIGRPIANAQVYILDPFLNPVPTGVPGEMYIGGIGLARGYRNRPDLTAERFIPNPFSKESGARLYKSGDLANYLSDGNIEFLCRIDNQVKIRGIRIELGEIESFLTQNPSIQQAVVLAREDTPGDKRLVAYVVAAADSAISAAQLRSFLQLKLVDYMVPSAYVFLKSLPLMPNGKVDCKALPIPDPYKLDLGDGFVAPRTTTEKIVANIWADVLKLETVGLHNNFFHLGGDSLLATQIISRIRQVFSIELPLRHIFDSPTVAEMAMLIVDTQTQQVNEADLA